MSDGIVGHEDGAVVLWREAQRFPIAGVEVSVKKAEHGWNGIEAGDEHEDQGQQQNKVGEANGQIWLDGAEIEIGAFNKPPCEDDRWNADERDAVEVSQCTLAVDQALMQPQMVENGVADVDPVKREQIFGEHKTP